MFGLLKKALKTMKSDCIHNKAEEVQLHLVKVEPVSLLDFVTQERLEEVLSPKNHHIKIEKTLEVSSKSVFNKGPLLKLLPTLRMFSKTCNSYITSSARQGIEPMVNVYL